MFAYGLSGRLRMHELSKSGEMKENQMLVDVREYQEYHLRHLPNAVSLPLAELETRANDFLDQSKQVYVYGRSRSQALLACVILQELGYRASSIGTMSSWPYDTITRW